jgi:hypothetical protein
MAEVVDVSDQAPLAYDPEERSDLDLIADEIMQEASPPLRLQHPTRTDYTLVFDMGHLDAATLERYHRQATRGKTRNARLLNGLIVGNHCVRVERNGIALEDSRGTVIDFGNTELMSLLKVNSRADTAARFLGGDGYLAATANAVLEHAGYGADVEEADRPDPTGSG